MDTTANWFQFDCRLKAKDTEEAGCAPPGFSRVARGREQAVRSARHEGLAAVSRSSKQPGVITAGAIRRARRADPIRNLARAVCAPRGQHGENCDRERGRSGSVQYLDAADCDRVQ